MFTSSCRDSGFLLEDIIYNLIISFLKLQTTNARVKYKSSISTRVCLHVSLGVDRLMRNLIYKGGKPV